MSFNPAQHGVKDFDCCSQSQNNFLRRTAKRQQRHHYTQLHVAITADPKPAPEPVLGFYALNAHTIALNQLPAVHFAHPPRSGYIPAAFLSHLAVDYRYQGQGLGRILLVDALQQVKVASTLLGLRVVVLDVQDDGDAVAIQRRLNFYLGMGFQAFLSQPLRLFFNLAVLDSR